MLEVQLAVDGRANGRALNLHAQIVPDAERQLQVVVPFDDARAIAVDELPERHVAVLGVVAGVEVFVRRRETEDQSGNLVRFAADQLEPDGQDPAAEVLDTADGGDREGCGRLPVCHLRASARITVSPSSVVVSQWPMIGSTANRG